MTINTLKYIRKILNLKTPVYLNWKPLNYLNITYIIASITSSGFKYVNFLVLLKIDGIGNIKKTIIFIDSIEKNIALEKYLHFFLLNNLKVRGKKIIVSFSSILKAKKKNYCLKNFLNGNTRILICINVIKMEVDILV